MEQRLNIDNKSLPLVRWRLFATEALRKVALRQLTFTADDIWGELRKTHPQCPDDPRALGHVLKRAAKDQLISPTSEYMNSRSTLNHHRPIRVWKSLIFHKHNAQAVTVKS
jgi:hypothetical protein